MIAPFIISTIIRTQQIKPQPREGDVFISQIVLEPISAPIIAKPEPLPTIDPIAVVAAVDALSSDNGYAWGNCTWGVKNWRADLPDNLGNANSWYYMAIQDGLSVGHAPRVNAVAQTYGDSWLGHVALVTAVYGDGSFEVREMNYSGRGVIDSRTTSTGEFPNFIY